MANLPIVNSPSKQNNLGMVVPEDFGAKGDGTTDDSVALNLALATGNWVHLQRKTYRHTLPLVMSYAQKLTGTGAYSVLLFDPPTGNIKIPTPTWLSPTVNGTIGSTSYYYKVTALINGGETAGSTELVVSTGNATLSGVNSITLNWNSVNGAETYNIYRSTTTGAELKIGSVGNTASGTTQTYTDTSPTAGSGACPTTDTTNCVYQLVLNGNNAGTIANVAFSPSNALKVNTENWTPSALPGTVPPIHYAGQCVNCIMFNVSYTWNLHNVVIQGYGTGMFYNQEGEIFLSGGSTIGSNWIGIWTQAQQTYTSNATFSSNTVDVLSANGSGMFFTNVTFSGSNSPLNHGFACLRAIGQGYHFGYKNCWIENKHFPFYCETTATIINLIVDGCTISVDHTTASGVDTGGALAVLYGTKFVFQNCLLAPQGPLAADVHNLILTGDANTTGIMKNNKLFASGGGVFVNNLAQTGTLFYEDLVTMDVGNRSIAGGGPTSPLIIQPNQAAAGSSGTGIILRTFTKATTGSAQVAKNVLSIQQNDPYGGLQFGTDSFYNNTASIYGVQYLTAGYIYNVTGISSTGTVAHTLAGNTAVGSGVTTVTCNLNATESDTNYRISLTPYFNPGAGGCWISAKTTSNFTVSWATATGSASSIDWHILR